MTNQPYDIATLALHLGHEASDEGEHSEPIHLTSGYDFPSAEAAFLRFSGEQDGNVYSRYTNPTVRAFEQRIAALEGGEAAIGTASGMSAILAIAMTFCRSGDHIVSSNSIFGSTQVLFNQWLEKFGITTSYVAIDDPQAWQAATQHNTKLYFLETPSNPVMTLGDIAALSDLAKKNDVLMVVDNAFATPALQQPLKLGADLVMHSVTKFLDGQGRALGGSVVGSKALIDPLVGYLRTCGPTMSAFNAWIFLKGLETLHIRMAAHSHNALQLAQWLESHPQVDRVIYPYLPSHPQYELATRQQSAGGGVLSFCLKDADVAKVWQFVDHVKLFRISANLGDTKSIITHSATTTHSRISPEARAAAGVSDNLIRLSVGLEAIEDLKNGLSQGFDHIRT